MKIIDANVVLRYLLKDEEQSFLKAVKIIENSNIYIKNEVFAEIVYVLEKVYLISRLRIRDVLSKFIEFNNVISDDKEIILQALNFYEANNLDFVDALLLSYNRVRKIEVITFDKKLKRLLEIKQ